MCCAQCKNSGMIYVNVKNLRCNQSVPVSARVQEELSALQSKAWQASLCHRLVTYCKIPHRQTGCNRQYEPHTSYMASGAGCPKQHWHVQQHWQNRGSKDNAVRQFCEEKLEVGPSFMSARGGGGGGRGVMPSFAPSSRMRMISRISP